jgi:hypothetical protein
MNQPKTKRIASYVRSRNEALTNLDMDWAKAMMPSAPSDWMLLAAMHKARYDCPDITEKLRHQSGDWLRQHGMGAMFGVLLPPGELPQ